MFICVYLCLFAFVFVCVYLCLFVFVCICLYLFVFVCVCLCLFVLVSVWSPLRFINQDQAAFQIPTKRETELEVAGVGWDDTRFFL